MTWINYFDIGLGNGLRNQLAKALTLKDYKLGKIYVSTTFAILSVIVVFFIILFLIINPYVEWNKVLNTNPEMASDLSRIVLIVFTFFCLQFIFKTVGTILVADQKPAINDLISVIGNLIALIIIYALTKITIGSLTYVALTFSSAPLLVFVFTYFILFYGKYKYLRPSFSAINLKYTKDLIGIGLQFFIIQIAVCVIAYTSTNIIIAQLLDTESVTIYNIAFKYFF
jgi:O-antigen/teichoic acid export membrane protein